MSIDISDSNDCAYPTNDVCYFAISKRLKKSCLSTIDTYLLNHAREITERGIDELHEQLKRPGCDKPRTYSEVARIDFIRFAKKRKPIISKSGTQSAICYGTEKRKYGLDRAEAKLDIMTLTTISTGIFMKKAESISKKRAIESVK